MFYQDKKFIDGFITLVRECNEIILNIYKTDFDVKYKGDESPLTIADKKCNEHICKYLNSLNLEHDILIISEENKQMDYEHRKHYDWVWLVDPLDGTKEFVKKNGEFTVNIGLCYKGIPVFGIVSIPVTNDIYYGVKDVGSFKLSHHGSLEKLNMKDIKENETVRLIVSKSHMNELTQNIVNQYPNNELLSVGSSIKLLWVAEGKAHIYPRIALTSEWDTCAAHAIVKYAGGVVIQHTTDKELVYNKENILNPHFVVRK
jgi:3'(2'), 5'-bisphosphate nucleotidase